MQSVVRWFVTCTIAWLMDVLDEDAPTSGQDQIQKQADEDIDMNDASPPPEPETEAGATPQPRHACKCSNGAEKQGNRIKTLKPGTQFDEAIKLLAECLPLIDFLCFNHVRLLASNGFALLSSTGGISRFLLLHRLRYVKFNITGYPY